MVGSVQLAPFALLLTLTACTAVPARHAASAVPKRVSLAHDVGPADGDSIIDVVLVLRARAHAVAVDARSLTPREFGDQYGPSRADYAQMVAWLHDQGLAIVRTADSRTTVATRGPVAAYARVFGLDFRMFADAHGRFRAFTSEPIYPGPLAGRVLAAIGLHDAVHLKTPHQTMPPPTPIQGETPDQLQTLYGVQGLAQHGDGETVAILGTGLPPDPQSDVGAFLALFGRPPLAANQYTQVFVDGPNRDPAGEARSELIENVLDAEMVLAMASRANVVHVLTATNEVGLFTNGISYIVNELPQAHAVSCSYGQCERGSQTDFLGIDALFDQARAQGQQWFFASGDDGSDDCGDRAAGLVPAVDFPASMPWVVAVGGTELAGTPPAEVAWSQSGGGQSEEFAKPDYQQGIGPFASDGVRDVPDVAALAGAPGVAIVHGGREFPIGGTSAAAPMWAGVWALIDQSQGGAGMPQGHAELYRLGAGGHGFHDITSGGNAIGTVPGFNAGPGFDLTTGWGTPDVPALISNWGK
jgi:kumamolisin